MTERAAPTLEQLLAARAELTAALPAINRAYHLISNDPFHARAYTELVDLIGDLNRHIGAATP